MAMMFGNMHAWIQRLLARAPAGNKIAGRVNTLLTKFAPQVATASAPTELGMGRATGAAAAPMPQLGLGMLGGRPAGAKSLLGR